MSREAICVEPEPEFRDKRFPMAATIEAAGRLWVVNPKAENLSHLVVGYYATQQLPGSKLEEIRRYCQGRNVFVRDGKPVVPEYVDEVYAFDELEILRDVPLELGLDIGGGTLQPACIIAQRHPRGAWLLHDEVICPDMGMERFCDEIWTRLNDRFAGLAIGAAYGDPAGAKRDEIFETVVFDHLISRGIPVEPAPSNDPKLRAESITNALGRMISGKPGVMIHKRCKALRKGLAGDWHYRRVQVVGQDRYRDTPDKNDSSHPCDSLGYLLMGSSEYSALTRPKDKGRARFTGTVTVNTDFNL